MTYTVSGTVTLDGVPAADGTPVQIWSYDPGHTVGTLLATVVVAGGAGAYTANVPDNTHDYRALYDSGATARGISILAPPLGSANPVASFTWAATTLVTTFTDHSTDIDGSIVSWAWTFGDGGTSTLQNPVHTYAAAGTYTVALTVTDSQGLTNVSTNPAVTVSQAIAPVYVAAGAMVVASSIQSVTPSWPAGVQIGDIGIMVLAALGQTDYPLTDPQGFVQAGSSPQHQISDDLNARLTVWWCRATSTTPAAPTIGDIVDDAKVGRIFTIRGCPAAGNPFDTTAGDAALTTTAVSVPGGTTTTAACLIVSVVACRIDTVTPQASGWTNPDLVNVTERIDEHSNISVGYGMLVTTGEKVSQGPFGPTQATLATTSTQARWMGALKPA